MALTTITVETRDTYHSIEEIKQDNRNIGQHYFDPATMRFFRSKVASRIVFGGHYFVTSEQYQAWDGHLEPRLYSVRSCFNGKIDTVGEFQQYQTVEQAKSAARHAARAFLEAN